ncbi:hypothetical protein PybrP1_012907 [[Pythium] brassicae (nom. inval.)]|nr:hypothetical protein PybrP1_012907 [[Pythium] brassicae (nom. inval.)]
MALSGTLAITVHRIEVETPSGGSDRLERLSVKIKIGSDEKRTKVVHGQKASDIEQTLNFDLENLNGDEDVRIEIVPENKSDSRYIGNKTQVSQFLRNADNMAVTFQSDGAKPTTVKLYVSSVWAPKDSTQKYFGEGASRTVETARAAVTGHPQTALAVQETHRPWFTRVSYYYNTTKHVYAYTTSFRVVSPFARLGESSANLVLRTVSGKNLRELDQQFVAPALDTLDNKVDATISTVVTKLFEGQQFVVKKKNDAVGTAGRVASKGSSSVSAAVSSTVSGVVKAKDYTKTRLANTSSAAVSAVVGAKDFTATQVASTYKAVKGTAVYAVSHIPVLVRMSA